MTDEEISTWVLAVDGKSFLLSAATESTGDRPRTVFFWVDTRLSWSDGETVALSLEVRNLPAQGVVVIEGPLQVGGTVSARAEVTDPNGDVGEDTVFSYQWIFVTLDGSESLIEDASGSTYTLPFSLPPGYLKVTASFTDDWGFEESITSDEVVFRNVGEIWAARLTVGQNPDATADLGFGPSYDGDALSGRNFSYLNESYQVDELAWFQEELGLGNTQGVLRLGLDGGMSADDAGALRLSIETNTGLKDWDVVDRRADASVLNGSSPAQVEWLNPSLGWSKGDKRKVALSVENRSGDGTVEILGQPKVGRLLSVQVRDLTDPNGLPANPFYTYSWSRCNGEDSCQPISSAATRSTYRLASEDEGKTIKVTVAYRDSLGYFNSLDSEPVGPVEARSEAVNFWTATVTVKQSATSAGTIGYHVVDARYLGSGITEGNVTFGASSYVVRSVLLTDGRTLKFTFSPPPSDEEIELWILDTPLRELHLADADLVKSSGPGIPTTAEFIWGWSGRAGLVQRRHDPAVPEGPQQSRPGRCDHRRTGDGQHPDRRHLGPHRPGRRTGRRRLHPPVD